MRKVKFNKWIPRIDEKHGLGTKPKEGTHCWEKDFPNDGIFHQWANAYEESNGSFGNYTVALVELPDGTISEVFPSNIKFVEHDDRYWRDENDFRHATEEKKQELLDALAKEGKRWNAEKKCVEDIPKRKFKAGDKVKIKDGISSKTHNGVGPSFVDTMDKFIGKELTVKEYSSGGWVVFYGGGLEYEFAEDWLEPWSDEPKIGDLAIFWDNDSLNPLIRLYHGKSYSGNNHIDNFGTVWENAIKWDGTKEQFERLIKGEI